MDRRIDVEILPDFPLVPKAEARIQAKRAPAASTDKATNRKEAL
jgi:hypothetical protein